MLIAGGIVLGVPYVLGLSIAAGSNFDEESGWLAVPVVGPWIMMATRDECSDADFGCVDDSGIRSLLVIDALMQTGGAVLLIVGVVAKKKRLVSVDVGGVSVAPAVVGNAAYGVGVSATF